MKKAFPVLSLLAMAALFTACQSDNSAQSQSSAASSTTETTQEAAAAPEAKPASSTAAAAKKVQGTAPTDVTPAMKNAMDQGLVIRDVVVGTGTVADNGREVTVNYTGKFENGQVFDSSEGRGPFRFVLGHGQVIRGWEVGIQGMKVGGKRKLIIPPSLGYGRQGAGDKIPPNSTLIFDVELLEVK